MESILITGASGFIGSFLVEEALRRRMKVWAGVRKSSSRAYLSQPELNFLVLDCSDDDTLAAQLDAHRREHGPFDYVIHCAGATRCRDKADFDRVNYGQTRRLAETLQRLDMMPKQFLFVSTLSVFGPIHERDFLPIREDDTPRPNTAYGRSKLRAERFLQAMEGMPYVIFRPTGVYGPRERDYFLMMQSIKRHFDTTAGLGRQDLTFVYVKDLVAAVFLAIDRGVTRRAYAVSDGQVYTSRTFSDLVHDALGRPWLIRLKCPLFLLKFVSLLAETCSRLRGTTSTLNSDKYNIMKQRNWQCDITPLVDELGYVPRYDLRRGVRESVDWYKKEGWL